VERRGQFQPRCATTCHIRMLDGGCPADDTLKSRVAIAAVAAFSSVAFHLLSVILLQFAPWSSRTLCSVFFSDLVALRSLSASCRISKRKTGPATPVRPYLPIHHFAISREIRGSSHWQTSRRKTRSTSTASVFSASYLVLHHSFSTPTWWGPCRMHSRSTSSPETTLLPGMCILGQCQQLSGRP